MVKQVTDAALAARESRGAQIRRVPAVVEIPELKGLLEQHAAMKQEKMAKWDENHAEKMAKFDQLIKAIEEAAARTGPMPQPVDLKPLMALVREIKNMKMMEPPEMEEREPCEYLLTFSRDQRGLIDGEKGIKFTPVG